MVKKMAKSDLLSFLACVMLSVFAAPVQVWIEKAGSNTSLEPHQYRYGLRTGMNVARFNFSHGSHDYHQETLDNLKIAQQNTQILCAVMLDTKGPEIRTGFLKDAKPVQLREGQEVTMTTDCDIKGDEKMIAMSYKKLAVDLKPGNTILCADGTLTLTVLSCDPQAGTVRCRCENTVVIGERKNVFLPGVVVDLPTLTEKDNWPEEGTIPLNSTRQGWGMAILRNKLVIRLLAILPNKGAPILLHLDTHLLAIQAHLLVMDTAWVVGGMLAGGAAAATPAFGTHQMAHNTGHGAHNPGQGAFYGHAPGHGAHGGKGKFKNHGKFKHGKGKHGGGKFKKWK